MEEQSKRTKGKHVSTLTLSPYCKSAMAGVGSRIRKARKERSMSVSEMARLLMCARTSIYKIEQGDPGVSFGLVVAALQVLGLEETITALARPVSSPN